MKTRELQDMMKEDSQMDLSSLEIESLKTPTLHGKYYGILMQEVRILRAAEQEFDTLNKFKFLYYTGRCADNVYEENPLDLKVTKADLDIWLKADEELQTLNRKLHIQRSKCEMLENYLKSVINARGFQIKDAIAFLNFKNGVV